MLLEKTSIRSQGFVGKPEELLSEVSIFLNNVKENNLTAHSFSLVHALVFSKSSSSSEIDNLNLALSDIYRKCGFNVLGGDTSSGNELCIFISTVAF